MNNKFGAITLKEALPRLVAAYNKGKLVPFTGAGISAPSIPLWKKMVQNLSKSCDLKLPRDFGATPQQLIQYSEEAVTRLIRQSPSKFVRTVKESLGYVGDQQPTITPQCQSLSNIWWPLVITTNYDTMFVDAYTKAQKDFGPSPIGIFGRNQLDCHSMLSKLNTGINTAYWALQGYFGKSMNGKLLEEEIVLGYRQYRNASYSNPLFRAVFGEVFRNNSLLFLGSGLTEDYFLGLFGEVLEKFGSNPHTHCALFSEQDADRIDHRFLNTKLNIVAIFYKDAGVKYKGLAPALDLLHHSIQKGSTRLWKMGYAYRSFDEKNISKAGLDLEISADPMPASSEGECLVYSAGMDANGIMFKTIGREYLESRYKAYDRNNFKQIKTTQCWQYYNDKKETHIYAAVARNNIGASSYRSRDLRMVYTAFKQTLEVLHRRYSVINIMLLATGKNRIFPPIYSLNAMLKAYRDFIREYEPGEINKVRCTIKIHVTDPSVILYIRKNALEIEEIISCDDIRLNIEIHDRGEIERFQIYVASHQPLASLSEYYSIDKKYWDVRIEPLPYFGQTLRPDARDELYALGLIPGSTIVYARK